MSAGAIVFIVIVVMVWLNERDHVETHREKKLQERHEELLQQQEDLAAEAQEREEQREWDRTHPITIAEEWARTHYKDGKYIEPIADDKTTAE